MGETEVTPMPSMSGSPRKQSQGEFSICKEEWGWPPTKGHEVGVLLPWVCRNETPLLSG